MRGVRPRTAIGGAPGAPSCGLDPLSREIRCACRARAARREPPPLPDPRRATAERGTCARLVAAVPPGAGSAVMGTGIVSVALELDGRAAASDALLVAAAVAAAVLAALRAASLRLDAGRLAREARQPASLTAVAAACVLGTRLTGAGWSWAGGALLVCAVAAWAPLMRSVLREWRTPARGTAFLVAVSTEAIAVLCAAIAAAALAAGATALALRLAHAALGLQGALRGLALALWVLAMAWLPALALGELARPRLRFDARRWSTVFPVGMYAAMSFVVGEEERLGWMVAFARAWTPVAVAVWLVVAAATAGRAARLLRASGGHRPDGRRVERGDAGNHRACATDATPDPRSRTTRS
jgi:hypothetical protein